MKGDTPIILTVVLIYASGTYFGVILPKQGLPTVDWVTVISSTIAAGVGAIAGAVAAFRLEKRRRRKEGDAILISNGDRTLFDLWAICNNLSQYQAELLSEIQDKDPKEHWYWLLPTNSPHTAESLLEPSRFQFLLGTEASQLATELYIERQRYEVFLSQEQERSRILREFARPRWEEAGIGAERMPTLAEMTNATGPHYFSVLRALTTYITQSVPKDIESIEINFGKL